MTDNNITETAIVALTDTTVSTATAEKTPAPAPVDVPSDVPAPVDVPNDDEIEEVTTTIIKMAEKLVEKEAKKKKKDEKKEKKLKVTDGEKKKTSTKDEKKKDGGEKKEKKLKVVKKDKKESAEKNPADEMFPEKFTVHGVVFSRKIISAEKAVEDFMKIYNDEDAVFIATYIPPEILKSTKRQKSLYSIEYGVAAPSKFPYDLDVSLVTALLPRRQKIDSLSIYTEATTELLFKSLRVDKYGVIRPFGSKEAVYLMLYTADFSKADVNVAPPYIDIFSDGDADSENGDKKNESGDSVHSVQK